MHNKTLNIWSLVSWIFGICVLIAGLINVFWGNDPFFGIMISLLAFTFFPPVTAIVKKLTGVPIPVIAKIILGILIIWALLGVGELFNKIEMMVRDL